MRYFLCYYKLNICRNIALDRKTCKRTEQKIPTGERVLSAMLIQTSTSTIMMRKGDNQCYERFYRFVKMAWR
jgi:hypothetical protein